MHMMAARLGCEESWLGPGRPSLTQSAWTGLQNTSLTLLILAMKAAWALSRCMTTESVDYCMLVN